jgi:ribosomal protein L14E/L6E/L27E
MEKGNLVVATRGKEKNQFFVIMNVEDKFAYIVDGKRLKLTNPKKKSMKHISIASKDKFSVELFKVNNDNVNSAVRKFIKEEKEKTCQKMM